MLQSVLPLQFVIVMVVGLSVAVVIGVLTAKDWVLFIFLQALPDSFFFALLLMFDVVLGLFMYQGGRLRDASETIYCWGVVDETIAFSWGKEK